MDTAGKTWADISDKEKCKLLYRPSRKALVIPCDMPLADAIALIEENAVNPDNQGA